MGIGKTMGLALMAMKNDLNFHGNCLMLGRQDIAIPVARAVYFAIERGLIVCTQENIKEVTAPYFARELKVGRKASDNVTAETFFNILGFDQVDSVDVSDYEGATIEHDLNNPNLIDKTRRKYNLIYDGGCMEHIFDIRNVFKNIFDCLEVGGYVFHSAPSNNYLDHGFYQFSPTLFRDYYTVNGYEILELSVFHYKNNEADSWTRLDYQTGELDKYTGTLDNAIYFTLAVARKTATSTWDVIPQQGAYTRSIMWVAGKA